MLAVAAEGKRNRTPFVYAAAAMRPQRLLLAVALCLPLGPLVTGCVKPYQLELLSLKAMDPSAEEMEDHIRQHWQESREGARGGYSAAGGGCGCN